MYSDCYLTVNEKNYKHKRSFIYNPHPPSGISVTESCRPDCDLKKYGHLSSTSSTLFTSVF